MLQLYSIVHPGHTDDLGVKADAGAAETLEGFENIKVIAVAHHLLAQGFICGVHRDVERTDVLVYNALEIRFAEIGE